MDIMTKLRMFSLNLKKALPEEMSGGADDDDDIVTEESESASNQSASILTW